MWRVSAAGIFANGEQAQTNVLAGHGVIAREDFGLAAADAVAARIAGMRNHRAVMPQRTGDDGRGHGAAGFEHLGVGLLHQARQQREVRLIFGGCAKSGQQRLDGQL